MNNAGTHCEVATGQESIEYCEGFVEHMHRQPLERHPRNEEEAFVKLYRSHYDED